MGVIETMRYVYEIDVRDRGTRHLVASEKQVQRSAGQTSRVLKAQDSAARRSASVAQQTSRRRVTAARAEASANDKVAASAMRAYRAQRRASAPGVIRRTASSATGSVKGAAAGVVGIVSIASAKQAVDVTTELAKTTISLNKNLGIGVTQASRWAAVARSRNIDSKALNQSFVTLSKNIGKVGSEQGKYETKLKALGSSEKDQEKRHKLIAKGAGDTTAAFKKLGISQDELDNNDFDTVLKKAADGLAAMPPGAERAALSAKLFGRGWQTIVPILRGGSKAMDEQLKLADKYGVTFKGKTVKSLEELIAAQREAKFASMGLQVAFGTQVAPALTKVINKGSQFARQMRDGTGAGGRFAKQAGEIADDLRPVGSALKSVGGFLAAHPRLVLAAAGAYVAFKSARGAVKIVDDLRAMKTAIGAVRTAAAKSSIATHIASGASGAAGKMRRALSGVKGVITSMMRGAGTSGGAVAAENLARSTSTNMGPALDRHQNGITGGKGGGRWGRMGKLAGRAFGVALVAGLLIGYREEISNAWQKIKDDISGRNKAGDEPIDAPDTWRAPPPRRIATGRKRRGGIVRRYQDGGLVPIAAAGGELLVDRGRATMIPGRDDQDATMMWARPGSAVVTYDGQARMAAGASLAEAIRAQAPHFAKGGVVPGKYTATSYGPPWGGIQGTGITKTGVNLKGNPQLYGIATDPRMIPLGSKVFAHPNPFGYTGRFSAFDTGGAIKGRRIDFYDWRGRRRQNQWGRRPVTISRARIAPRGGGEDTYRAPGGGGAEATIAILGRNRRRAGLLGDAFAQGRAAGQSGLTLSAIKREGNPVTRAIAEAMAGAGTQPDKGSTASKEKIAAADTGAFASGGRLARMHAKASAIDAKRYQYSWGGGHGRIGVPTVGSRTPRGGKRGLGYDCSGAVSAVLGAGGLLKSPLTSGALMNWGRKGSSQNLAVYADPGHTIMRIGRRYFGTGEANPNGGAGWLPNNTMKGRGAVRTAGRAASIKATRRSASSKAKPGHSTPISDRVMGYRRGGIVGYAGGGTVGAGSRLSAGLARTMTFAGGTFEALDTIIQRAAEQRLLALRTQVTRQVRRGGPKRVIARLQGVLDLIDSELGRRVGRAEDVIEQRTSKMERGRGAVDRAMRARGMNADSAQGLGVMGAQQAAETGVRQQNVATLQKALRTATRARNQEAIRDLTGKLHEAQDELHESIVRQVELARDQIRATGAEAVGAAGFVAGLAQTGVAGVEAAQRLNRTQDTPDGMRERAAAIQGGVVPALQAQMQAHQYNAQLLASIGDLDGWRSAVQDAAAAAVDIASAQADAADLMRDATAKLAQDMVDAASHGRRMSDLGLDRLETEQRKVGTFDSAGGAQGRADFIRQNIIPSIQAEIAALQLQLDDAQRSGNADLVRQLKEQIFGEQTEIMKRDLDANQQTAENTDLLKEFAGASAFSYRDTTYTDSSIDVIAARLGA
jgi:3D (Asp-Asp-Asp) domain-containing protein